MRDRLRELFDKTVRYVERAWGHRITEWVIWGLPIILCVYFLFNTPSPGVGGILLAILAAIIPLRVEKMTPLYKAGFAVLIVGLVCVELKSIGKEHDDHIAEAKALKDDFDKQERHMDEIYGETESIFKNLTGGDSRPEIAPQPHWGLSVDNGSESREAIPLVMWNMGDYPLTDISVTIADGDNWNGDSPFAFYSRPDLTVSLIPPHEFKPLKTLLVPNLQPLTPSRLCIVQTRAHGLKRGCLDAFATVTASGFPLREKRLYQFVEAQLLSTGRRSVLDVELDGLRERRIVRTELFNALDGLSANIECQRRFPVAKALHQKLTSPFLTLALGIE